MSRYPNDEDRTIYAVIVNSAGRYSLWPACEGPPAGWKSVGKTGRRQECLDYIGTQMTTEPSQPNEGSVTDRLP